MAATAAAASAVVWRKLARSTLESSHCCCCCKASKPYPPLATEGGKLAVSLPKGVGGERALALQSVAVAAFAAIKSANSAKEKPEDEGAQLRRGRFS